MSQLGIMKTVARTEMLELGSLTDDQLRCINRIAQAFYDVGYTDGSNDSSPNKEE